MSFRYEYKSKVLMPWISIENNYLLNTSYITTGLNPVNGLSVDTNVKFKSSISILNENLHFNWNR